MPLSKAEKESILNRLRAEYDVLLPDNSPFNPENTIAILERKLNRLKSQATGDRPEVEKENDIKDTEWRIAELRKPNWKIVPDPLLKTPRWMLRKLFAMASTEM